MNTYRIEVLGYSGKTWFYTEQGETPGQAKYRLFIRNEFGDDFSFGDFLKRRIKSCRLVHKFTPSDLFDNEEHFMGMTERRHIHFAFMGQQIKVAGKPGVIVGANSADNLDVCFDGTCDRSNCHPYWRTKYYDKHGNIVMEYGD